MRDIKLSRRATLQVLGATPLLAGLLAACKKTEPDSCSDVSALSAGDATLRNALQYTDHSPDKDKHCNNCNLFKAAADVAQCGSCTMVKGPIHPDGHCTNWVAKA